MAGVLGVDDEPQWRLKVRVGSVENDGEQLLSMASPSLM